MAVLCNGIHECYGESSSIDPDMDFEDECLAQCRNESSNLCTNSASLSSPEGRLVEHIYDGCMINVRVSLMAVCRGRFILSI